MTRAGRAIITALALATMLALFGAAAAGAADYPPSDPAPGHLTLPSSVAVNGMVDYSGSGCGATQPVDVAFDGTPMDSTTSDGGGNVSGRFAVPADTQPGDHTVAVSNNFCSLSGTVSVLGESVTLPHTGSSNTIPIVISALAAIVVGFTLVAAARRRRRLVHTTH